MIHCLFPFYHRLIQKEKKDWKLHKKNVLSRRSHLNCKIKINLARMIQYKMYMLFYGEFIEKKLREFVDELGTVEIKLIKPEH